MYISVSMLMVILVALLVRSLLPDDYNKPSDPSTKQYERDEREAARIAFLATPPRWYLWPILLAFDVLSVWMLIDTLWGTTSAWLSVPSASVWGIGTIALIAHAVHAHRATGIAQEAHSAPAEDVRAQRFQVLCARRR